MLRKLLCFIIIVQTQLPAYALGAMSWQVLVSQAPVSDQPVTSAMFEDPNQQVMIYRVGEEVWLSFLRLDSLQFRPESPVVLQVDSNSPNPISPDISQEMEHLMGRPSLVIKPDSVSLLLWHGLENEGCGYILELGNGDSLNMQFMDADGEQRSADVPLSGVKSALINALALKQCLQK